MKTSDIHFHTCYKTFRRQYHLCCRMFEAEKKIETHRRVKSDEHILATTGITSTLPQSQWTHKNTEQWFTNFTTTTGETLFWYAIKTSKNVTPRIKSVMKSLAKFMVMLILSICFFRSSVDRFGFTCIVNLKITFVEVILVFEFHSLFFTFFYLSLSCCPVRWSCQSPLANH